MSVPCIAEQVTVRLQEEGHQTPDLGGARFRVSEFFRLAMRSKRSCNTADNHAACA